MVQSKDKSNKKTLLKDFLLLHALTSFIKDLDLLQEVFKSDRTGTPSRVSIIMRFKI